MEMSLKGKQQKTYTAKVNITSCYGLALKCITMYQRFGHQPVALLGGDRTFRELLGHGECPWRRYGDPGPFLSLSLCFPVTTLPQLLP
jgi:hypothetical protein